MARKNEEKSTELATDFRHYVCDLDTSYRSISASMLMSSSDSTTSFLIGKNSLAIYDDNDDNNNNNNNEKMRALTKENSWYEWMDHDGDMIQSIRMGKGEKEGKEIKMDMGMNMETLIFNEQVIKSEPEKLKEIPVWSEGVDQFTNYVTKSNISPSSLMISTKEILEQLNTDKDLFCGNNNDDDSDSDDSNSDNNNNDKKKNNNNNNNSDNSILTYKVHNENMFRCRLAPDEDRICTFDIIIYRYEKENCLLDIQELSGEHLTFAHFLHAFKSKLQQRQIIEELTFTPDFMDNYGLSMDIGLEDF